MQYEEIIEQARQSWSGLEGDRRAENVKNIIDTRLDNYSKHTGFSKDEILVALEKKRGVNCTNFYQSANLPLLEEVLLYENVEEFRDKHPSGKSICPSCEKESTNYYECTQADCDWKVYGFLGDLGKGVHIALKDVFLDHPVPHNVFKPIELVQNTTV